MIPRLPRSSKGTRAYRALLSAADNASRHHVPGRASSSHHSTPLHPRRLGLPTGLIGKMTCWLQTGEKPSHVQDNRRYTHGDCAIGSRLLGVGPASLVSRLPHTWPDRSLVSTCCGKHEFLWCHATMRSTLLPFRHPASWHGQNPCLLPPPLT